MHTQHEYLAALRQDREEASEARAASFRRVSVTALHAALWLAVGLMAFTAGAQRAANKCLADIEVCRTIAGAR